MPPSTRVYTVEQYSVACIGESANVTRCRRIRFSRRVSGATIANGDVVDKQAIRYRIFGTSTGIINCNLCGTISNAQKIDRQHTAAPTAGRFYDILVGTCNGAINAALTYLNTFDRTVRRKSQYAGIGDSFSNRNLYTAITRLCLIPRVFINPYWIFCAAARSNYAASRHRRYRQHAEYHNQNQQKSNESLFPSFGSPPFYCLFRVVETDLC